MLEVAAFDGDETVRPLWTIDGEVPGGPVLRVPYCGACGEVAALGALAAAGAPVAR
ncbi:hypothetical protein [Saccharopolyspora gloriosae]|uniref:hypothetical protein n=1 Tax=Saccharopolyspora gloriosae TaxID=455344 RepID=UPI0037C4FFF1